MKYKFFKCIYVYKRDKTIKTFQSVYHVCKGHCDRISLITIQGKSNNENLSNSEGMIKVRMTKEFRLIMVNNKRQIPYTVPLVNTKRQSL